MADTHLTYNPRTLSFFCSGCMETTEVRRKDANDPEALLNVKELMALDHAECPNYKDPVMAQRARKYRKEGKRRALAAGAGS
jgi:hypothetical protein